MIWRQNREVSNEYVSKLALEFDVSELLVRILLNRNNDKEFARIVLRDTYQAIIPAEKLVNGQAIADRITYHINNNSEIHIYADYDCDGLNSGFIMYSVILEIINFIKSRAVVFVHFPERTDGYGLSTQFAKNLIENKSNNKKTLVITVDNGIAQLKQIEMLIANQIDVVITDHHKNKKEGIPDCLICDPHNEFVKQDDTFHHLCGTAIAFKICELLQKNFGYHDMYRFVVNVALATITDVMPLSHPENIAFVKDGLDIINSDMCPVSILAMKEFLGIEIMNSQHIAWEIGPRLNACGRMNNTKLGAKLLLETDIFNAIDLVNEIELINESRKEYTKKGKEQLNAMDFSNDNICIIQLDGIPKGIEGIIASNAVDKFKKPSIVATEHDGICKGSARSIEGLDLQVLFNIELEKGNILDFGGHSEAAGITFKQDKLENLKASLNTTIDSLTSLNKDIEKENKILLIDECIKIEHLNSNAFNLINELPYDKGVFPRPIFALTYCEVQEFTPTLTNPENLWLILKQGNRSIKLWCEGMTKVYKSIGCPKVIHLAGYIEKNFMNTRPYILRTIDIIDAS